MSTFTQTNTTAAKLRSNQAGAASFLVTLVLMIVVTLIVIGFAQISRRNEREALDDQLSSQAFYAAETGSNLVRKLMLTNSGDSLKKSTCAASGIYLNAQLSDPVASPTPEVSNSCLIVDNAPTSLVYDDIGINSTVVPLQPASLTGPGGKLTITWQPKATNPGDGISNCPAFGTFPTTANWNTHCPFGVLRFDMVQLPASGTVLTESSLESSSQTVFAPPATSHAAIVKTEGYMEGTPGTVTCSDSSCSLTINNVDFGDTYYMRLTSLYKDVAVSSITGTSSPATGSQPVQFTGAQIAVDSTGKASDVLRRIQVRLDENNQLAPSFAIQGSSGICKQYATIGPSPFDVGTTDNTACPLP